MKKANIATLKNSLSEYLRYVRQGQEVLVLDRQRPVAKIIPLSHASSKSIDEDEHLRSLVEKGLVTPPRAKLPKDFWERPWPKAKGSVLQALLDEREENPR